MELPLKIQDMLKHSERIDVEFKKEIPGDLLEHIMGFANRNGGHILIGVDGIINQDGSQTGNPIGFISNDIDKDKQKIDSWARSLQPTVTLLTNQEYKLQNGHWLIHVQVKEQTEKPVGTMRGLYKIRGHSGTNPMDHSAMRSAVFEEIRALKSLRECLNRNIAHASSVLRNITRDKLDLTVFEKGMIVSALSNPDVYEKVDIVDLSVVYQAYEIVDKLIEVRINWRPIGANHKEIDGLIINHTKDAITRSNNLLKKINSILS